MIATSVADSVDGALAFGLLTAVAVLGLILVTAVTTPRAGSPDADPDLEALGERVETEVQLLVRDGADEEALRRLVGDAVRLGQGRAGGAGQRSGNPTAGHRR
jgi:hypothetical protein